MRHLATRILSVEGAPIGIALFVAIVVFSALNPAFLTATNLSNVVVQSAFILFIAVGMTFVLGSGAIDLSVGGVLGASGGVAMLVLITGVPFPVAVAAGLGTGLLFGLFNGLLVTRLGLSDFIVTLGTMGVAAGLLEIISFLQPLRAPSGSELFTGMARGTLAGIPIPILIGVPLVVFMDVLMRRSEFGRRVRAVGMSAPAARFAGINVTRIRMAVFAISGLMAGVAGVLLAARLASVPPALGRGYELEAIAAAVLGGTSLAGGKGTALGSALAALLLATIKTGLQVVGVDPTWYQVVLGLSILLAVGFHTWADRFVEETYLGNGRKAQGVPSVSARGHGPGHVERGAHH